MIPGTNLNELYPKDFRNYGKKDWFASIDIETTGLDINIDQILEVAIILCPMKHIELIDNLPQLRIRIKHDIIHSSSMYALSLHKELFEDINKTKAIFNIDDWKYKGYPVAKNIEETIKFNRDDFLFLVRGFLINTFGDNKVTLAGKNIGFDKKFLDRDFNFTKECNIHYRSLDPGILYFDPKIDTEIPSTEECLKRTGINKKVSHGALEDAKDVINLLQYKWFIQSKKEK